jgi:HAD superfamily hydrolase (TIGR01490 family)
MTAAAFFDLDNTLIKGASLYVLARHALRSGFYTRRAIMRDAFTQLSFRLGSNTDDISERLKDRVGRSVAGKLQADMMALADAIVADIEALVFAGARQRVAEHREQGHRTYVVSASSAEIVEPVARRLGIDGAIATWPEIDTDGRYTGRIRGPFVYGPGKARAVRELAEREGIDLTASWAYSDSSSDLPLLEMVGHPVVVNPDSGLERIAAERGWEVLRFERLGRRLAVAGGAVVGVGAGTAAALILGLRRLRRSRQSSRAGISPTPRGRRRSGTSSSGTPPSGGRQGRGERRRQQPAGPPAPRPRLFRLRDRPQWPPASRPDQESGSGPRTGGTWSRRGRRR